MKLARGLEVGPEAVTEAMADLGRRGSGKTYGALKRAELFLEAGAQIVVADPVGKWWALRLAADGKSPGFEIPVFGGHHGDLPLRPESGALLADLIVEKGISAVLDVSLLRKGDRKRFAAEFAERLYDRKKGEVDPAPLHLFLEEAQLYVPQRVMGSDARMVGAFEDLVKLGRNCGIGATLISQRPQAVNKDVLTQCECLFVYQTTGAQERKALREWIRDASSGHHDELVDELPTLEQGECYVWSPGWLRTFKRVRILKRTTFDASATPKLRSGKRRAGTETRPLSADELAELEAAMASVVEVEKANDPKALKARIAKLERELRKAEAQAPAPSEEQLEAARKQGAREVWEQAERARQASLAEFGLAQREFEKAIANLGAPTWVKLEVPPPPRPQKMATRSATPTQPDRFKPVAGTRGTGDPNHTLAGWTPARQKILDGLAWLESAGIQRGRRPIVALASGTLHTSSYFERNLGAMRSGGLIDYPEGGRVQLTDEGRRIASAPATVATSADLHARLRELLKPALWAIVEVLVDVHPEALDRAELARRAGTEASSSYFERNLGSLRSSLELVEYPAPGQVRARDALFL